MFELVSLGSVERMPPQIAKRDESTGLETRSGTGQMKFQFEATVSVDSISPFTVMRVCIRSVSDASADDFLAHSACSLTPVSLAPRTKPGWAKFMVVRPSLVHRPDPSALSEAAGDDTGA